MKITIDTINDYLENGGMVESVDEVSKEYEDLGIDAKGIIPLILPFFGGPATGCFLAGLALGVRLCQEDMAKAKDEMQSELAELIKDVENDSQGT